MPTSKRRKPDTADRTACEPTDGDQRSHSLLITLAEADRLWLIDKAISALAHEMAQPLTSIANYANACARLLQAGTASREELLEAMQHTAAEALRANDVIRRVQGISARGDSRRARASVNDLVREVVAAQQPAMGGYKIRLSLRLADDLPVVQVNPLQIQLVLMHLIRNALEAMSGLSPEQWSLTIETLSTGNAVSVRVVDSGPAVDSAIVAKMFEPYFTTKPHGLGLGLSVCQTLIKAHGGCLGAQPNSTSGLTVQFTLPITAE